MGMLYKRSVDTLTIAQRNYRSMKTLIPATCLFLLLGCERNSSEPQTDANAEVDSGAASANVVASGKASDADEKALKGKVSAHGLYRLVRSGGLVDAPNTGTGKAVVKPVIEQVRSTDRIPMLKGAQMYLQYRIWPLPSQPAYVDLRRVLKHPEIRLPDGSVSTGSDYMIKGKISSNQVIAYTGYGLDEDYELVEGEWTFEIWYEEKKVIEQKFTTYRPDAEEIAKLEPILALGNKAVGQRPQTAKPFSRFDWPKIVVGGSQPEAPATPSSDAPESVD